VQAGIGARTEDILMLTAQECRQHAQDCLQLAVRSDDFFAQDALVRRAGFFQHMASDLKNRALKREHQYETGFEVQRNLRHV